MQVLNTYRINTNTFNYTHSNKIVYKRMRQLFNVLDDIILEKSKKHFHILSGHVIKLLECENFETCLKMLIDSL